MEIVVKMNELITLPSEHDSPSIEASFCIVSYKSTDTIMNGNDKIELIKA